MELYGLTCGLLDKPHMLASALHVVVHSLDTAPHALHTTWGCHTLPHTADILGPMLHVVLGPGSVHPVLALHPVCVISFRTGAWSPAGLDWQCVLRPTWDQHEVSAAHDTQAGLGTAVSVGGGLLLPAVPGPASGQLMPCAGPSGWHMLCTVCSLESGPQALHSGLLWSGLQTGP